VSTVTSTVEPSTGDKRPREDDSEQQHANQPPATRSPQVGNFSNNGNATNGAYGGGPMAGIQVGNPGGQNQGYDALYIGDLQWVCVTVLKNPVRY
jgi:hypothetical protein